MAKFKVGDKVVVQEDDANYAVVNKGDIGIIKSMDYDGNTIIYKALIDGVIWWFRDEHIELATAKFKVGDEIIITKGHCYSQFIKNGDIGKICDVWAHGIYGVGIRGCYGFVAEDAMVLKEKVAASSKLTLPIDSDERKDYPMYSGLLAYFPAALAGVAHHSKLGNDKHNPGESLHHARGKSMDHEDCIIRHLVDLADILASEEIDKEAALTEANALCWRALALSQKLHEKYGAPLAPGAKE